MGNRDAAYKVPLRNTNRDQPFNLKKGGYGITVKSHFSECFHGNFLNYPEIEETLTLLLTIHNHIFNYFPIQYHSLVKENSMKGNIQFFPISLLW